jgi:hypothetical protein
VGADADGDLGEIRLTSVWRDYQTDKAILGPDSSFVHDPSVDSTKIAGTVSFGKPNTLGTPTAAGYPFVFRNPGSFSTYLLIESGRTGIDGAAGIRFLPSLGQETTFQYGSSTSKNLSFYSFTVGKNVMQLGSYSALPGNPNTIIMGNDAPIQWGYNGKLVVYDTITSGKALFLSKKVASSSTPIAMFSSAANDRFTFDDNGTYQMHTYGSGAMEAPDLSKTESVYDAVYATDGTVLERHSKVERYATITSTSSPQTLSNDYSDNLINQGSTQATFTLTFPASPVDGQVLKITYNNAISVLTLDGNGNVIVGSAVTTAVPGSQRKFKFYTGVGWMKIY